MKIGTIKRVKVNPKTDQAAVLFEDGKAYYLTSLRAARHLMNSFENGNPIGCRIGYELSEDKIDEDGIIGKFWVVD